MFEDLLYQVLFLLTQLLVLLTIVYSQVYLQLWWLLLLEDVSLVLG